MTYETKGMKSLGTINQLLGRPGRLLDSSKLTYRQNHPDNVVVFNANVCTKSEKLWFGDVDVARDEQKLKELAAFLDEDIFVLYEMDGRFENEATPLIERACAVISPQGQVTVKEQ